MSNKINIKNADIKIESNKIVLMYPLEEDESIINNLDLSDAINDFVNKKIDVVIKEHKNRKSPQMPPKFKYKCSGCGTEITSKVEGLVVECKECGELFNAE